MSQHQSDGTFRPFACYLQPPLLLLPALSLFFHCSPKCSRWRHLSSLHSKQPSSAICLLPWWGLTYNSGSFRTFFFFNEVLMVVVFLNSIILYLLPTEDILHSWSGKVDNTAKKHALKYYCAEACILDHLFHFISFLVCICLSLRFFFVSYNLYLYMIYQKSPTG